MLPLVFLAITVLPLPANIEPDLFAGADKHTSAELEVAGMMTLYPGRVLSAPPRTIETGNKGRPPRIVELRRELTYYLRVFDLGASLPQIATYLGKPGLILDLRYVSADAKAAEDFAALLNKAGLASAPLHGVGVIKDPENFPAPGAADKDHPAPVVLALVNGETSGPLEAWLEVFQEKESVLTVGTPTLGQPGHYVEYPDQPGYFIIDGELRPDSGSLAGKGVTPRFIVDVTPQQNLVAYLLVERSTADIPAMLRQEHTVAPTPVAATAPALPTAGTNANSPATQQTAPTAAPSTTVIIEARDPVLQRAVDVLAALQVLGRLPSLKDAGAKAPATTAPAK